MMNSTTNDIKKMIGQMIIVGLRGTSPDDAKYLFNQYVRKLEISFQSQLVGLKYFS